VAQRGDIYACMALLSYQEQLLGHTLVSAPYWEWERCQGAGEREQYLRSKLDGCRPFRFSKIEPLDSD